MPPSERAAESVEVIFAASGKQAQWTQGSGSLLALAEAQGLRPVVGCEEGWCGSCVTPILLGAVEYQVASVAELAAGDCLICCAVPAAATRQTGRLILDL
jgi:ferredoxin